MILYTSVTMSERTQFIIKGDWDKQFNRFIGKLGGLSTSWRRSEPEVQNKAAHIIAAVYRRFIRDGIEPENSKLTQILRGIYPPLSGLADYIIVVESGPSRATGAYPGRPKPALVTWKKEWTTIAFMHDVGYAFIPSPEQRRRLFADAMDVVGSPDNLFEEGMSSGGYWIVPARPHSHFLGSPLMDKILIAIAEAHTNGVAYDLTSSRPKAEPYKAFDRSGGNRVNIDDVRDL